MLALAVCMLSRGFMRHENQCVIQNCSGVDRMERHVSKNFNTAQSGLSTRSHFIFWQTLAKCDVKTVEGFRLHVDDAGMSVYLKRVPIPRRLHTLRDVLAYNLRASRLARGLSQEQLGFAAQLDRTFISQVERARVNISLDNLDKLARALALDAHELLHPPFSAWAPAKRDLPTKQNAVNLTVDGVEA